MIGGGDGVGAESERGRVTPSRALRRSLSLCSSGCSSQNEGGKGGDGQEAELHPPRFMAVYEHQCQRAAEGE